ncbi:MAG: Ig-like domain-containing protein [Anaerovoracaceae bacterium]|jgi:hypothetical protein
MKRISAILMLSLILVMLGSTAAFGASELSVVETSPKDGATNQSIDNMGVKVTFNKAVYSKKYMKANQKKCHLVDNKGKNVPHRVAFNSDEKDIMLVVADTSADAKKKARIKSKTRYTLVIDEGFTAADGSTLNDRASTTFETQNRKTSMRISMGMMGVMVVGMIFMTQREQKRQQKEEKEQSGEPINPYKEAKRTGKTVEEIVAREEKKKARAAKDAAKKERYRRENKEEIASENMRVPRPRPIAEAGSTYRYPVKQPKAQSRSTHPRNQTGRQRNTKKH